MIRCMCPFVLVILLMTSANSVEVWRQTENRCYFCQNAECLKKQTTKNNGLQYRKDEFDEYKKGNMGIVIGGTPREEKKLKTKRNSMRIWRQAESKRTCELCADEECSRSRIESCTKETMSSMEMYGARMLWDLMVKTGTEFDDPSKYNLCFRIFYAVNDGHLIQLKGCAPPEIGHLKFCDHAKGTVEKLSYDLLECTSDQKEEHNYTLGWDWFVCYYCEDVRWQNCQKKMHCSVDRMSSRPMSENTRKMWNSLLAGAAELDDVKKTRRCFAIVWDFEAHGQQMQRALWGCAPEKVGEQEFCDYINSTATKNNYTISGCITGEAGRRPWKLLPLPTKQKCYLCQHSDCLEPSRILDCEEKPIDYSYLDKDALRMWNDLNEMSLPSSYKECFAIMWEDEKSGKKTLWGCAYQYDFCENFELLAQDSNYKALGCHICTPTEEPCFFNSSLFTAMTTEDTTTTATTKFKWRRSSGIMLYHHVVFYWIISAILFENLL